MENRAFRKCLIALMILSKLSCRSFDQEQRLNALAPESTWAIAGYLPDDPNAKVWLHIKDGIIQSIDNIEPEFPFIDTEGLIFPSLIDLYGQLSSPKVDEFIRSSDLKKDEICAVLRWSELKALTAGVGVISYPDQRYRHCVKDFAVENVEFLGNMLKPESFEFLGSGNQHLDTVLEQQGVSQWIEDFRLPPNNFASGLALLIGKTNLPSWVSGLNSLNANSLQDSELISTLIDHFGVQENRLPTVLRDMQFWLEAYLNLSKEELLNEQEAWRYLVKPGVFVIAEPIRTYIRDFEIPIKREILKNSEAKILRLDADFSVLRDFGIEQPGLILQQVLNMDSSQLKTAGAKDISIVWTPYADLVAYRKTLDLSAAQKYKVNLTLGSDGFSPKHLLDQMKFARSYLNRDMQEDFSDKDLVDMVTVNAARALRLEDRIGYVSVGYRADLLIIDRCPGDPYSCLIRSEQQNIKLVTINGQGQFGDHSILSEGLGLWQRQGNYEVLPSRRSSGCLRRDKAFWLGSPMSEYDQELNLDSSRPDLRSFQGIEETVLGIGMNDFLFSCEDKNYLEQLTKSMMP